MPQTSELVASLAASVNEMLEHMQLTELLRALTHNIQLYADDVPHVDHVVLKRELRKQIKMARKLLAMVKHAKS